MFVFERQVMLRIIYHFIFFAAALLCLSPAGSQTLIQGKVRDTKSRPVAGASVSIRDSYDGATADSAGNFSFRTTEKGDQVLEVTSVGYRKAEQVIRPAGAPLAVIFELKEEISELSAVVITAGSFEASDRKRAVAVLDPIDIVTTASANGDITGALKTLPGAQQVGESEGLFVRGGTAGETKTFIDGTLVNNFFYSSVPNIAQFGRFSPFIFKGTVFSTGGYSALYGQALSAALILESIDMPDRSSANLGISVLNGSLGYQHVAKNKKSSFGLSYSYTDLSLAFALIKQRQDYSRVPAYHGSDFNFRVKTSATGILKYYGYYNNNKLAFTVPSLDSLGYLDYFSLSNKSHYHNLSWRETLGKGWKIIPGVSFSDNRDAIRGALQDEDKRDVVLQGLEFRNFGLQARGRYFNAKLVLEKKLGGLSALRFGSEYNYGRDRAQFHDYLQRLYEDTVVSRLISVFSESDIYVTNALAMKAGLRMEHSALLGKSNLAPRLSVAYKLGTGSQASFAYGIFYQEPERRYLPSPAELEFMKATHYILQYQKVLNQRSFRAEVFYKDYDRLLKTGDPSFGGRAVGNGGQGYAKGIEIFWRDKKTIRDFDYWISYSYLDTQRDFLNFPSAITPNFAAKHTASVVAKKFVQSIKTNVNAAYNFASGRPYYHIARDGNQTKFTDRGLIPSYHNVSIALNYLPKIGKPDARSFAVYVLQVSNVLNINQVYGYQYSANGLRKERIVPTSRMFIFLGAFISIGVDRSGEIMNNIM